MNKERYFLTMLGVGQMTKTPPIAHGVDGLLSRPEANWLNKIPIFVGDGKYVELGTFRGKSACLIAGCMKDLKLRANLVTIDTFDDRAVSRKFTEEGIVTSSGDGKSDKRYKAVRELFNEKKLNDYISIEIMHTVTASNLFKEGEIDFLFIDADHSYEAVKADFNAWEPKMKKSGIIAFHDSHREDVARFHKEIKTWTEIDRVDTLSVWTKN